MIITTQVFLIVHGRHGRGEKWAHSNPGLSENAKISRRTAKEENYLHREHRVGTFRREVALPEHLDTDKGEATPENGILTVTIPRIAGAKPKTLKIDVKALEGEKA